MISEAFVEGHYRWGPQVFAELNKEHLGGDGFPRALRWWQRKSIILSRIFGFIAAAVSIFAQRIRIGLRSKMGPATKINTPSRLHPSRPHRLGPTTHFFHAESCTAEGNVLGTTMTIGTRMMVSTTMTVNSHNKNNGLSIHPLGHPHEKSLVT
jgi:hypothetical protein